MAGDAVTVVKKLPFVPTHALTSLFLHALPVAQAASVLEALAGQVKRMIIADLIEPASVLHKAFLHLDERMAGHYNQYLAYREAGGMPALLGSAGLKTIKETPSPVSGVHVWVCGKTDGS